MDFLTSGVSLIFSGPSSNFRPDEDLLNPPEAIRNSVTPLATPRCDRPGFLTPIATPPSVRLGSFFLSPFASERQRPYHGFTDRVYLTPVAIPLSVRPGFFLII